MRKHTVNKTVSEQKAAQADFQFDGLGDFVVQKAEKGCVNVENGVKFGEQQR